MNQQSKFMFKDGTHVYNNVDTEYNKHDKGYVILGPPGIGKTTYVNNQISDDKKKNWIDADYLLGQLNVNWHLNEQNEIDFKLNYLRADYILEQSKLLGYRIIGALFWIYNADAIVIPDYDMHIKFASQRTDLSLDFVIKMRNEFTKHANKYNIPMFKTIEEAINFLESK